MNFNEVRISGDKVRWAEEKDYLQLKEESSQEDITSVKLVWNTMFILYVSLDTFCKVI